MEQLHLNANNFFYNEQYNDAINIYKELIENNYKKDIMYSNCGACYLKLKDYTKSLNDSLKAVEINLNYSKAWGRVGYSYKGLNMDSNACKAFEIANKLDKDNQNYKNEMTYYFDKLSNKINITNIFSLLKNNNNLFSKLKELKSEILNSSPTKIFENNNIKKFMESVIENL
jgi:small glutamine-rich tetratricopeptide repeat-containing protein alpha